MECAEKPNYLGKKDFFLLSHTEKHKAREHILRETTILTKLFFSLQKDKCLKAWANTYFFFFLVSSYLIFLLHFQTINSICVLDPFSTLTFPSCLEIQCLWTGEITRTMLILLHPRVGIPLGQVLHKTSKEVFFIPKSFWIQYKKLQRDSGGRARWIWYYWSAQSTMNIFHSLFPLRIKKLFGYLHRKISSNEKLFWVQKQPDKMMHLPFWFTHAFGSHPLQCSS